MRIELVNESLYRDLYNFTPPCEDLRSVIEYYFEDIKPGYFKRNHKTPECTLPDIGFSVGFNLGSSHVLSNQLKTYFLNDHIIMPKNYTWTDYNSTHFFIIKFKFSFLPYTHGLSQSAMQSQIHPARMFLDPSFVKSIESASSYEERTEISNNYFSQLYYTYRRKIQPYIIVTDIIKEMRDNLCDFRISAKSTEKFLTSRTLLRYFLRNIGLSPKECLRIIRLRQAVHSYFNKPDFSLADFGYFDHSHFYRDLFQITGFKLGQLKKIHSTEKNINNMNNHSVSAGSLVS